ncbi:MAG: hypothetical protein EOP84_34410, partial [Verrucomicrobiaceae bacterium]
MQTLLAFLPVAQTAPSGNPVNAILEQLRQQSQVDPGTVTLSFIIVQIIAIMAILIASKAVVPDRYRTNIGNALKVWGLGWAVAIVSVVLIVVIVVVLSAIGAPQLAGIALLGLLLLTILLTILIPMRTYEIRFFRSIGLLIISVVVMIIGQIAVTFVIGPPPGQQWAVVQQIMNLTPAQRQELFTAMKNDQKVSRPAGPLLPGEKEARDPSRPMAERGNALKTMYVELERRRQAIAPG